MSGGRGMEMQAEPALQERFWRGDEVGFAWEGTADGCFAAGGGSVLQLIPTNLQGCGLVIALVSQRSGRRCQVLWQWPLGRSANSCPVLVISLSCWSYQYQNLAVWSQGKLCLLVSCLPQGWGCGSLGVPSLLGPWVGFPHRRSRRAGMEHSDRHPDLGAKCPWAWIFGWNFVLESASVIAVPLPEPDGSYWSIREGVRGAEAGWQSYPQHCTEMSPRLSFNAVLPKPPGPLSRVFRDRNWPWALHVSSGSLWTHTFLRGEGPKHTSSRIWLWLMQLRSITQNISHMT